MPLFLVGLGLGNESDVSVNGLNAIKKSDKVFLESYTSILGVDVQKLEQYYGKKVELADRECVESESDRILDEAREKNVSFLVVGDPYCATTHTDLALRARALGIQVKVFHNACIMSAVGCCGLQLYNYGQTISICFFRDSSSDETQPTSYYEKVKINRQHGLHTLCLLDIKVKEPDLDALCRGKKVFLPPRYMSIANAVQQLLYVEENIRKGGAYNRSTMCVGLARVGREDQLVIAGAMGELATVDFGGPLHSLIIVGEMHELEKEMLMEFHYSKVDDLKRVPWAEKFLKKENKATPMNAGPSAPTQLASTPGINVPSNECKPAKVERGVNDAQEEQEEVTMNIAALINDDSDDDDSDGSDD